MSLVIIDVFLLFILGCLLRIVWVSVHPERKDKK